MDLIPLKKEKITYAPGIATYGVDGIPGEQGQNGNCIFFTDYNIEDQNTNSIKKDSDDIVNFNNAISKNLYLMKNNTNKNPRSYQTGDYIITSNSNIYEILDIDNLKNSNDNNNYLRWVGKISIISNQNETKYFEYDNVTNRLNLADNYKGINIIRGNNISVNTDANLNLISNQQYDADDITFLSMLSSGVTSNDGDNYLNFEYNKELNAFKLNSNIPLVINSSEITFNATSQSDYIQSDEYVPVETSTANNRKTFKDVIDGIKVTANIYQLAKYISVVNNDTTTQSQKAPVLLGRAQTTPTNDTNMTFDRWESGVAKQEFLVNNARVNGGIFKGTISAPAQGGGSGSGASGSGGTVEENTGGNTPDNPIKAMLQLLETYSVITLKHTNNNDISEGDSVWDYLTTNTSCLVYYTDGTLQNLDISNVIKRNTVNLNTYNGLSTFDVSVLSDVLINRIPAKVGFVNMFEYIKIPEIVNQKIFYIE